MGVIIPRQREAERDRIRDQQINRSMFKNAKKGQSSINKAPYLFTESEIKPYQIFVGSARKEWSGSAGQGLSQRRAEREAAFDFEKKECLQGHSKYSMCRVRIALAKNAGFSQNGSHMLLSLLASFCKTSMKQDKSKSTVACAIHFVSTQHF